MNIHQLVAAFRNPQMIVSLLSTLVAAFGGVGIFNAPLTGALQGVLTAVLALIVAVTHTSASVALVRRAARKTAVQSSGPAAA